jgi:hypothetical protein
VRREGVVAGGATPGADAPRPKRARALKSATTPSKKQQQKATKE